VHLVQILLPLYDNDGAPLPRAAFQSVRDELTRRFGGLTAYTRAPAEGVGTESGGTTRDDIVVFEVMTDALEHEWWRDYRRMLERRFRQDTAVVRATTATLL
jgi:hypothetical protein